MSKRIGLVGHCGADSSYLRIAVGKASPGATVVNLEDDRALQQAIGDGIDLLLINRIVEGYSSEDGVDYIRQYKKLHPNIPMMLVSNYPDAQQDAEQAGAHPGFGKREVLSPKTVERIKAALGSEIPAR